MKLRKNCTWVQFVTEWHPMRSLSHKALATIAPWKSALGAGNGHWRQDVGLNDFKSIYHLDHLLRLSPKPL